MKTKLNITYAAFALFAFACFALVPQARAACQHGCDTSNGNTFLGDDALISNTTGTDNTAMGFNALFSNFGGVRNTAIGSGAASANRGNCNNTAIGYTALFRNNGNNNIAIGYHAG